MGRFFIGLGIATLLALGIVQQRVALIQAGYQVESLRRLKEDLLDQHRVLQYNVLTLQSPVILSQRLAQRDVRLAPPISVEVLAGSLEARPWTRMDQIPFTAGGGPRWIQQIRHLASRWLEGGRQAEAEPTLQEENLSAGM
ncbi:MAG: hypothetical protein HYZ93_06110 [Candidatus Omnitrophica bacterium]|nr:hypothetical protein [Candidatus Omnitrophota bacterium]